MKEIKKEKTLSEIFLNSARFTDKVLMIFLGAFVVVCSIMTYAIVSNFSPIFIAHYKLFMGVGFSLVISEMVFLIFAFLTKGSEERRRKFNEDRKEELAAEIVKQLKKSKQ